MTYLRSTFFTVLIAWMMFPATVTSQDLGIPAILYPEPNQNVHLQYTYDVVFTLKNYDSSPVAQSTLINFDLLFDNVLYNTYNLTLSNQLGAGDSLTITIPPLTISTGGSNVNMCVVVKLGTDMNPLNDTSCNLLPFSIDNNVDLEPNFLDITFPARDSIVLVDEYIHKMDAYILNVGTVTLPREYPLSLEYTMYGIKKSINTKTTEPLAPGERITANLLSFPQIQSTPGTFNICVKVIDPADVEPGNNEYCKPFFAVDYTGIEEQNAEYNVQTIQDGSQIRISCAKCSDVMMVNLINSLGQAVQSVTMSENTGNTTVISTEGRKPGLYILQVVNAQNTKGYTEKVVIR